VLTTSPPSCADCHEIWEPQPPGTPRACTWVALPFILLWEPQISQHIFSVCFVYGLFNSAVSVSQLWPILLNDVNVISSPECSVQLWGMRLSSHLNLVLRLWMNGAVAGQRREPGLLQVGGLDMQLYPHIIRTQLSWIPWWGIDAEVPRKDKRWWNICLRNFQNAIDITVMPGL